MSQMRSHFEKYAFYITF